MKPEKVDRVRKKRALKLEEVFTFQNSQLSAFTSTKRFEMEVHCTDLNQFFSTLRLANWF